MKNIEKRKRVVARSMHLGHCICDPKKACPCDVLREKDVCPCAGETVEDAMHPVGLMGLVESAGCASKVDQATLRRLIEGLPFHDDPRILLGAPAGDDAGVYRLDDHTALVQTVDVFTPAVNDPYLFGRIAAANSLSDVYAMGGRPITALSVVSFPLHTVAEDVLRQILRGGIDAMNEAGVAVLGGHSINDSQLKAGFAVTGLIDPERIVTNAGARPGDRLILTKPLGTGILAFAAQIGRAPAAALEAAAQSMVALNDRAAALMLECGARACTDVTGFGLLGHLGAMAAASGVDVEITWDDLPVLPGVVQCLADGIASGAVERNRESSGGCLMADDGVTPAMLDLCFDPQTSGGLLIAAPEAAAGTVLRQLHDAGIRAAAVIGRVVSTGAGRVHVRTNSRRHAEGDSPIFVDTKIRTVPDLAIGATREDKTQTEEDANMSCCQGDHAGGGLAATKRVFQEFLGAAAALGALDGKTKQAIAIALSVFARCEPCAISHIQKARQMGFSPEEIDEAAWVAVAFGGSPVMVFYNGVRKAAEPAAG